MSAMLAADYRDQTIKALETLRNAFINKHDQMVELRKTFREAGDQANVNYSIVAAATWRVAIDDIAVAIQKEQGR